MFVYACVYVCVCVWGRGGGGAGGVVVWWFLCGLLLLKIIVGGCLGDGVKFVGFVCALFESC